MNKSNGFCWARYVDCIVKWDMQINTPSINVREEIILCLDWRTVTSLSNLGVLHEVEENTASYDENAPVRPVWPWHGKERIGTVCITSRIALSGIFFLFIYLFIYLFINIEIHFLLLGVHVLGTSPVSVIRKPRIALTFKGRHDMLNSFCQYDIIADQRTNNCHRTSTVKSKRNMLWLGFDLRGSG